MKKKKQSISDLLRQWSMPPVAIRCGKQFLRYRNPLEKGIYWYWFSLYVRQRDVQKYGTCISCGKPITVETSDAGHFIPAASCGIELLFDPLNVNAECNRCNAWDELHLLGYAKNLDKRYGHGMADSLLERYRHRTVQKEWKKEKYEQLITLLPSYQNRNTIPT